MNIAELRGRWTVSVFPKPNVTEWDRGIVAPMDSSPRGRRSCSVIPTDARVLGLVRAAGEADLAHEGAAQRVSYFGSRPERLEMPGPAAVRIPLQGPHCASSDLICGGT